LVSTSTVAIIPVRTIPSAKHRLASLLDSTSRRKLAVAMLEDVLDAAKKAHEINRIIILTSEKKLLNANLLQKYEVYTTKSNGLNSELIDCTRLIEEQGADAAIIILADLPLLTAQVLDTLVHLGYQQSRPVVAMDWAGTGTNILYLSPPTFLNPHFGANSLQAHMKAAKRRGTSAICFAALESALDIDDQDSLNRFLQINTTILQTKETNTSRLLRQIIK
jgi:2-phospho-L-lactate guanylyltransferase